MRDFSLAAYSRLLDQLQAGVWKFQTFSDFLKTPEEKVVLLRHDVDARKLHSLRFARIQAERGIAGAYYFRIVPQSFDEGVIREIHQMGHEIGYHYEDMDLAKGDPHRAIQLFEKHLDMLRRIAPVSSICMHGSPLSRFDNRGLWKHYNYRDYGIIGEPYFDIDFRSVFYLTDTGRRWDGHQVSIRDKVENHFGLSFHTTPEIIAAIDAGHFPAQVMFTFHPQRWTDSYRLWLQEKWVQFLKNGVKYGKVKLLRNTG